MIAMFEKHLWSTGLLFSTFSSALLRDEKLGHLWNITAGNYIRQ